MARRKDWVEPSLPVCVQGGRRKITFRTKAEAKRYMHNGTGPKEKAPLRPYRCGRCGCFHLTSQPRREAY